MGRKAQTLEKILANTTHKEDCMCWNGCKDKETKKKNFVPYEEITNIQGGNTFINWAALPVSLMGAQEVENN